jgi:hypothetical protein
LKKQYGEYGDIKVRGNGMAEFVLKKVPARNGMTNKNGIEGEEKREKDNKTRKNNSKSNKTRKNRK